MPHLPWHGTSVFAVSSKGPPYIVTPAGLDDIKTFKIDNVKLSLHVRVSCELLDEEFKCNQTISFNFCLKRSKANILVCIY